MIVKKILTRFFWLVFFPNVFKYYYYIAQKAEINIFIELY